MNLAAAMFVKSLVLLAWAAFSEWKWPEEPEELLDEQGSGYSPAYSPLRLPAPEQPSSLSD